jgi:hypothetical protein
MKYRGGLKYGFMKCGGVHAEGTENVLSTCNQVHVKPGVDLPVAGKGVHPCWPWSIGVRKFRSETGKIRLPYLGYVDNFQRHALMGVIEMVPHNSLLILLATFV